MHSGFNLQMWGKCWGQQKKKWCGGTWSPTQSGMAHNMEMISRTAGWVSVTPSRFKMLRPTTRIWLKKKKSQYMAERIWMSTTTAFLYKNPYQIPSKKKYSEFRVWNLNKTKFQGKNVIDSDKIWMNGRSGTVLLYYHERETIWKIVKLVEKGKLRRKSAVIKLKMLEIILKTYHCN